MHVLDPKSVIWVVFWGAFWRSGSAVSVGFLAGVLGNRSDVHDRLLCACVGFPRSCERSDMPGPQWLWSAVASCSGLHGGVVLRRGGPRSAAAVIRLCCPDQHGAGHLGLPDGVPP
jgi:hypothetical protein